MNNKGEQYLPEPEQSEDSYALGATDDDAEHFNADSSDDNVSDISTSSEEKEELDDHDDDIEQPLSLLNGEEGPYGHDLTEESFDLPAATSEHSQSGMAGDANLIPNRSSISHVRLQPAGARENIASIVNSRFSRLPRSGGSASGSFSAMYGEGRRASSRFQQGMGFAGSANSHSNASSDQVSPYYEHTGGWLRLRPQNPAGFPTGSRFLNSNSQRSLDFDPNSDISERSPAVFSRYHQYDGMSSAESPSRYENYRRCYNEELSARQKETGLEEGPTEGKEEDGEIPDGFANLQIGKNDKETLMHGPTEHSPEPKVLNREETDNTGTLSEDQNEVKISEELKRAFDSRDQVQPLSRLNSAMDPSRSGSYVDTQWASPDSKYERYECRVDQHQGDRAVEIPLFVFQRPHMRAFHFAWMSFFVAFFTWFAISPLLPEIKNTLKLTHSEIWMSNICSSAGTVVCRIIVGPLNDRFGARWVMATTLAIAAMPVMFTGLVHNAVSLSILRLITGVAGSSFVTCQFWTSSMFSREISGTANSLAAGWGNLGGGITQIVMGSLLFPMFKAIYKETNSDSDSEKASAEKAWRTVCVIPAVVSLVMAFLVVKYSDDSPKGNYRKLKSLGLMPRVEARKALKAAASNYNTWLLAFHYGCCFGVEVTFTAGAALYFSEEFFQKTESAAALASIFGWMNLFARGLGGFISDIMNVKFGMRGRLLWQFLSVVLEGIFLLVFAHTSSLGGAIFTMIILSFFVQNAEVSLSIH